MAWKSNNQNHAEQPPRDHYAAVTDQVIAALEAGTLPWRRPWDTEKTGGPTMPCNATTGARYRGINVLTLGMSPFAFMSCDPRWATYKQAASKGWQVKKGERGTTAYFFKRLEVPSEGGAAGGNETKHIPLLRAFTLFNASQMDGPPDYEPPGIEEAPWRAPESTDTIVANSGAIVRIGGEKAFYSTGTDHIQMPPNFAFATAEGYASTILHELGHWTGAKHRLDRDLRNKFGSQDYAREELRAELAQTMVCAELGIADCNFDNNAAYIASWLETLRSDRKEIFRAAADAQRIADYLLAFHPAYAKRNEAAPGDDDGTTPSQTSDDTATPIAEAA